MFHKRLLKEFSDNRKYVKPSAEWPHAMTALFAK